MLKKKAGKAAVTKRGSEKNKEKKRSRGVFDQRVLPPRVGFIVLALVAVVLFLITYFRLSGVWTGKTIKDYIILAVVCAVSAAVSMVLLEAYLYFEKRALLTTPKRLLAFASLMVLASLLTAVSTLVSYAFNAVLVAIILCGILCSKRAAYTMTVMMTLTCFVMSFAFFGEGAMDKPTAVALAVFAGGVVSVLTLSGRSGRMIPLVAGAAGGAAAAAVLAGALVLLGKDAVSVLTDTAWMLGGCVLSGIIATGLLPLFENLFDVATDARLNELNNNNNPLLKRLMLEAPGTYHHSLIVAVMAESAAELVGANSLLCKTAAYYHDVGKLVSPRYFKENQGEYNIHDSLPPAESARHILAHPKDGAEMLAKNKFPSEIVRMTAQHHGDSAVYYFYTKARDMASDPDSVNLSDYRYNAPKPRTKEDAILMLADCCEAAVRALKHPTQEAIEERVRKIIAGLWQSPDSQLSESALTAKDIRTIEASFIKNLLAQYHERIEYPAGAASEPGPASRPAVAPGSQTVINTGSDAETVLEEYRDDTEN